MPDFATLPRPSTGQFKRLIEEAVAQTAARDPSAFLPPHKSAPAETEAVPDILDHVPIGGDGNAQIVRHSAWLAQARDLVGDFRERSGGYWFSRPIGPSVAAGFFIACEQQQACDVAWDMARHDESLQAILASGKPVPLVYGADSGLHTAIGFAAGLKKACPEADIQISPMIGRKVSDVDRSALEAAQESGVAIFCDSIICGGATCTGFMGALREVKRPLKILVYSNGALGSEENRQIEALGYIKSFVPKKDELVLRVSTIGFDPFDRGDAIAYIDDPHTRALQPMLLKRPLVDWGNPPPNKTAAPTRSDDASLAQTPGLSAAEAAFLRILLGAPQKADGDVRSNRQIVDKFSMTSSFSSLFLRTKRAKKKGALRKLVDFETTKAPYDLAVIDQITDAVRKHFAANGFAVNKKLSERIDAAKRRAHGISGESKLANFETTQTPYDSSSIKHIMKEIREHFAAGGIAVDEKLDERIDAAKRRAHGISGESKLTDFETTQTPYGSGSIDYITKEIREHFAAGGITVDEKLDERIQAAKQRAQELKPVECLEESKIGTREMESYVITDIMTERHSMGTPAIRSAFGSIPRSSPRPSREWIWKSLSPE